MPKAKAAASNSRKRRKQNSKRNEREVLEARRNLDILESSSILDIHAVLRLATPFVHSLEVFNAGTYMSEGVRSAYGLIASLYLVAATNAAKNSVIKDGIYDELGAMLTRRIRVPARLIPLLQGFGDTELLDDKKPVLGSFTNFVKSCIYIAQLCVFDKAKSNTRDMIKVSLDIPEGGYFFKSPSSIPHLKQMIADYIKNIRMKTYYRPLNEGENGTAPPGGVLGAGFSFPNLEGNPFPFIPEGFDFSNLDKGAIMAMYSLFNSKGDELLSDERSDQLASVLRALDTTLVNDSFDNYKSVFSRVFYELDYLQFYAEKFKCEDMVYSIVGDDPYIYW